MNSISRKINLAKQFTKEIVSWLDKPDPLQVAAKLKSLPEEHWQLLQRVALVQGVGPYLYYELSRSPHYSAIPAKFASWLSLEFHNNETRIQKMHTELREILVAAKQQGICLMPLKGSLLTTLYYPVAGIRPMADLDILVRPHELQAMQTILEQLGYQLNRKTGQSNKAFIYLKDEVPISWIGEHPKHPRPVDLHLNVNLSLDTGEVSPDITEALWTSCTESNLFGQPIWRPSHEMLLYHLAIHHAKHLYSNVGRAIQWLDIKQVARQTSSPLPYVDGWALYVPLRLAQRALPSQLSMLSTRPYASSCPQRLRQLVDKQQLNDHVGLTLYIDFDAPRKARWRRSLLRWRPNIWKLSLMYPDTPLPLAFLKYTLTLGLRAFKFLIRTYL